LSITITIRLRDGRPTCTITPPGAPITAAATLDGRRLRLALRGHGDIEARFALPNVIDIDVRGGHAYAIPGTPYIVRAPVDGWLSITARLGKESGVRRQESEPTAPDS